MCESFPRHTRARRTSREAALNRIRLGNGGSNSSQIRRLYINSWRSERLQLMLCNSSWLDSHYSSVKFIHMFVKKKNLERAGKFGYSSVSNGGFSPVFQHIWCGYLDQYKVLMYLIAWPTLKMDCVLLSSHSLFSIFLCLALFVCLFHFAFLVSFFPATSSKQTFCRHIFLLRVCVCMCSCHSCLLYVLKWSCVTLMIMQQTYSFDQPVSESARFFIY